ncbi:hypothetical protein NE237_006087 [Protea cynaroides]|uniref:Amino acid transporter transmembrane domain-containing protein n=1 Tax=Protea cynaroides TaxID=273540 RepID=A0A9Q0QUZ3_9MAGN|nr:hypothetical protein NE237_006087 [Protea cynaroides]
METETYKKETMESQSHVPEQTQKGATFLRTCFNGINALSGLLLRRCMDAHPRVKTYPDIGEVAFGYKGKALISTFMYLELYLIATEFLILEGDNLEKLFPNMSYQVAGLKIGGKQGFVLFAALAILPTTWLRNLGVLAYVSAGGVVASVVVVASVAWAGAVDGVGFHEKGKLLSLAGLPTAISLYAFSYSGHAVFPDICTSMKDKTQFPKVLAICFTLCTLNYGTMAVLGYLMYGGGVQSQVTLNLPLGKFSSKLAIYTTLVNPFTKYAIMTNPISTAIEDWGPFRNSRPMSLLIRTVLLISNVVVALSIPFFGYLMAFIGAFLSVVVSILLPCICYLKIFKGSRSFGSELVIICGILLLGVTVAVLGSRASISNHVGPTSTSYWSTSRPDISHKHSNRTCGPISPSLQVEDSKLSTNREQDHHGDLAWLNLSKSHLSKRTNEIIKLDRTRGVCLKSHNKN